MNWRFCLTFKERLVLRKGWMLQMSLSFFACGDKRIFWNSKLLKNGKRTKELLLSVSSLTSTSKSPLKHYPTFNWKTFLFPTSKNAFVSQSIESFASIKHTINHRGLSTHQTHNYHANCKQLSISTSLFVQRHTILFD